MRPLTPSESRLVKLLAAVLALVVVTFGMVAYRRNLASLRTEITALESRKAEADFWMAEKPLWDARRAWIRENMPVLPQDGSAASAFLSDIQAAATSAGLTISSQSLLEPVSSKEIEQIGLRLRVNGTLEQVVRWLAGLQHPEKFQAVTTFSLKSDKEPPAVVCELQMARFYRKDTVE